MTSSDKSKSSQRVTESSKNDVSSNTRPLSNKRNSDSDNIRIIQKFEAASARGPNPDPMLTSTMILSDSVNILKNSLTQRSLSSRKIPKKYKKNKDLVDLKLAESLLALSNENIKLRNHILKLEESPVSKSQRKLQE